MSCFDRTHAPVATTARTAATGLVCMSTRLDLEGSGTVEIVTRRCPCLRVVWDSRELTHQQKPRLWSLPARLGPVTVHTTRWGVGPRIVLLLSASSGPVVFPFAFVLLTIPSSFPIPIPISDLIRHGFDFISEPDSAFASNSGSNTVCFVFVLHFFFCFRCLAL